MPNCIDDVATGGDDARRFELDAVRSAGRAGIAFDDGGIARRGGSGNEASGGDMIETSVRCGEDVAGCGAVTARLEGCASAVGRLSNDSRMACCRRSFSSNASLPAASRPPRRLAR